jgi:PKD repeat protein
MGGESCKSRHGLVSHRRLLRTLGVALLGGCTLALALGRYPGTRGTVALACGSGNPVMSANGLLATLDPSTFNSGTDLPDTGGIFNLDYAAGQQIAFVEDLTYIGTTPPSGLKLRWQFGDSNTYVTTAAPSHTYAKPGTYLVYVEYFDTTSNSWLFFDYAHIQVVAAASVANPPVAHASTPTDSYEIGTDVTLDANGSKSADGSPLTYTWDFNDGTRASGVKVTHQYVLPGKTLVQLIVADGRGAKAVDTLNLVIVPTDGLPVAAVLPSATNVAPGGTITFDASQSHAPDILPNDQIVRFVWDFGDGTPKQTTTNPTTSHTYQRAGRYTVTVAAYDLQDASGVTTIAITVGAAGAQGSAPGHGAGGFPAPLLPLGGLALALLAVGGYFALQTQQRRNALIHERERAMQLARARQVTARRPTPPGRSESGSRPAQRSTGQHGPPRPRD